MAMSRRSWAVFGRSASAWQRLSIAVARGIYAREPVHKATAVMYGRGLPWEELDHADPLLRSWRLLAGLAHRAGGERREVRGQARRPGQGRAAHGGLPQDPSPRPRTGAAARQRRAAHREHGDPALSRQALRVVAEGCARR